MQQNYQKWSMIITEIIEPDNDNKQILKLSTAAV